MDPSSSSSPLPTPGEDPAAAVRRAKAQARKDKILSRGTDRLAKITNTTRDDGSTRDFLPNVDIPRRPSSNSMTPTPSAPGTSPSSPAARVDDLPDTPYRRPVHARSRSGLGQTNGSGRKEDEDPEEIDLGTQERLRQQEMMRQLMLLGGGGGPNGSSFAEQFSGDGSVPRFQPGFGMDAPSGAGGAGAGTNPFGLDPSQPLPPLLAQMLGGANTAGGLGADPLSGLANGGMGFPPGLGAVPARPRNWLDRLFPIFQAVCMAVLVWSAISIWEPVTRSSGGKVNEGLEGVYEATVEGENEKASWDGQGVNWGGWARLGTHRPGKVESALLGHVGQVPLLWLFITVELVLQSTRVLIFRNRPPAPLSGILGFAAPHLPPHILALISTAIRYVGLLNAFLDDFAVVVFGLGCWVALAEWKTRTGGVGEVFEHVRVEITRRDEL